MLNSLATVIYYSYVTGRYACVDAIYVWNIPIAFWVNV